MLISSVTAHTLAEDDIYRIVKDIILSAQVPPGTRLPEARLAPLFGVTRERLRKVLRRLGHEDVLEFVPNIGTIVPTPSLENARQLFEARRVLESGICVSLCDRITDDELAQVEEHLREEQSLADTGPRSAFITTSSHFHVLLASFIDNTFINTQLESLLSKSTLLSTFHDPRNVSICTCHEHRQIAAALSQRDVRAAHHAMVSHLSLIETRLQGFRGTVQKVDVEMIFRDSLKRDRGRGA